MRKPVAEDERRLLDDFLADELQLILARMRLRHVRVNTLDLRVIFLAEDRHVRQHRQRLERRRCSLRCEHVNVSDANPRFLSERRIEIDDALNDSASGREAGPDVARGQSAARLRVVVCGQLIESCPCCARGHTNPDFVSERVAGERRASEGGIPIPPISRRSSGVHGRRGGAACFAGRQHDRFRSSSCVSAILTPAEAVRKPGIPQHISRQPRIRRADLGRRGVRS